ncbi:hypothetical protein Tco_1056711 [Tanacetum coccineum]|uniref:Uncharacterized protein n=1 Tax=Tanacetum coccineum TaxID=301880 RepID=A0ABQ5H434_9ASTR
MASYWRSFSVTTEIDVACVMVRDRSIFIESDQRPKTKLVNRNKDVISRSTRWSALDCEYAGASLEAVSGVMCSISTIQGRHDDGYRNCLREGSAKCRTLSARWKDVARLNMSSHRKKL